MAVAKRGGLAWVALVAATLGLGRGAQGVVVEFDPLALAGQQVAARFARIEQEVARLNGLGEAGAAGAMQGKLQAFKDELSGVGVSPLTGPALDIVGIYRADGSGVDQPVVVNVGVTDRPMVLALGSALSARWDLQLAAGARLEKVVLFGPAGVGLLNPAPAGVTVEYGPVGSWLGYGRNLESQPFGARTAFLATGFGPSAVLGEYYAPTVPFEVGKQNPDWRAQHVLREMQGLYEDATAYEQALGRGRAAQYPVTAMQRQYEATSFGMREVGGVITPMDATGPRGETGLAIGGDPMLQITQDPKGAGSYYGIRQHSVWRIDPATGAATQMAVAGPGVQPFEWATGITYDTKRDRVLVSGLGGIGYLWAYSPATDVWQTITDLANRDISSIAYFEGTDSLYALRVSFGVSNVAELLRFDAVTGQYLGEVPLSRRITAGYSLGMLGVQMVASGDRLVLLAPPAADLWEPEQPDQPHGYLIDPLTGLVEYAGVLAGAVPIPEPGVAVATVAVGTAFMRRRSRR